MKTLQITDCIFNRYSGFYVQNKGVSPNDAYKFVMNARLRNINDFNIARMVKVQVGDSIESLLNLLTKV